jgi:hypothetical protein
MAKQLVNPIERHVEKAVLGLAGLALVAIIARFVITSPNQLELGGERATPNTIDQRVGQKTADVLARLRAAQPQPQVVEPLYDEFDAALKPIDKPPLALAVTLAPEVPIVDKGIVFGGQATLVRPKAPTKPVVSHGRGTLVTLTAAGDTRFVPSDWASVSAIFDTKAFLEVQKREYAPKGEDLVFAPPQLQRRQLRPDGSWSDGDWKDVTPSPAVKLPKEPVVVLTDEGGGKLTVDKDLLKAIESFRVDLAKPEMQLEVIRPLPPAMHLPTRWAVPAIGPHRELLKMDDEFLRPNDPPSTDPDDRYGLSVAPVAKQTPKQLTPEQTRAESMKEAQKLMESAKQNDSVNEAIRAANLMAEIITDREASAADKERAQKIRDDAEQIERDIRRRAVTGITKQPAPGTAATSVKPAREKLPAQQLWAHDAAPGSIENGAVYQYRMRFRVFNALAGGPTKFSNPADAAVVFVESEWSPPSDPVHIEPASLFFVTSDDAKDQEISAEFYQWYFGVWLKPERRVKAGIGDLLRDKQRVPAPDINDDTKMDRPEIEFAADATVVDIDFDRPLRERKQGTTPKGVRFAAPAASTSVVFMDSQGRLEERFMLLDKVNPQKREAESRKWTPKAKP